MLENIKDSVSSNQLYLSYSKLSKLPEDLNSLLVLNALSFGNKDLDRFREWISTNHIRILNVAGPRESAKPGVID